MGWGVNRAVISWCLGCWAAPATWGVSYTEGLADTRGAGRELAPARAEEIHDEPEHVLELGDDVELAENGVHLFVEPGEPLLHDVQHVDPRLAVGVGLVDKLHLVVDGVCNYLPDLLDLLPDGFSED